MASIEVDIELKTSADKVWSSIKDYVVLFPKVFPDIYRSVEVLEGDGKSAGSLRKVTYHPTGEGMTQAAMTMFRVEFVDEENKVICVKMVDGDVLKQYKKFVDKMAVRAKEGGEDGSVVTYTIEYEKISEDTPDPLHIKDYSIDLFHKLDAYLQEEGKN
ncbi:hypothetical protein M9H77_31421 [Catharanthus roseus]|uniref:Uncharacterized protein n=1 Tax=Catharanthus roseus TaxID=4058 RepID=A0ACC0A0D6_CATRO|nr:hypothetical protein M9H77_31421 [Catharanthus roseus]